MEEGEEGEEDNILYDLGSKFVFWNRILYDGSILCDFASLGKKSLKLQRISSYSYRLPSLKSRPVATNKIISNTFLELLF